MQNSFAQIHRSYNEESHHWQLYLLLALLSTLFSLVIPTLFILSK
jgi:hypothetical protein